MGIEKKNYQKNEIGLKTGVRAKDNFVAGE